MARRKSRDKRIKTYATAGHISTWLYGRRDGEFRARCQSEGKTLYLFLGKEDQLIVLTRRELRSLALLFMRHAMAHMQ
jgi:hypothetical protein